MIFNVTRTSERFKGAQPAPPCEEAEKEGRAWVIAVESLEGLMSFVAKYGEIVIEESSWQDEFTHPVIEIYDDYRE